MSDLISRRALRDAMYHQAFETDTEMQRWDSGCWIRYKLFENVIEHLPSAEPQIIRCKDCKHWLTLNDGYCEIWEQYISNDAFYCGCGERMESDK